ncbi:serine hydrolase domain-containing protein [Mumia zhuanghuii]|uniref:Beta-lactamase family protein n=1 Tax=Mumia zhuanghuii TaxID=2585211 RepID=A0A5C4MR48_9ACTN|nr:serine hydrolase domain-containing protein [Mumia zhuanghuii]TNC46818.1 beta-lactamase family protein [Mumia zhuanghuii]TNC47134.1 beta-lactamase family protein [Mumia zhuanghuii]
MPTVQGTYDPHFQPLIDALARRIDAGDEVGASLAIVQDGRMVVDVWGGHGDAERTTPWSEDTVTNVWSCTKTVTALAALIVHDRGLLDVHEKVATYWPEFAANGKADVEVRHLLAHTSGVPALDQPCAVEDLFDAEAAAARFAAQAPWWEPGTASGYHAINYGHLVGEVVRRVTGQSLKEFVATEIAGPLGADFTIGLPLDAYDRVSPIIAPTGVEMPPGVQPGPLAMRTLGGPPLHANVALTDAWRSADIGGVNGHGNARALATIQSAVSNGGVVGGHKLLGEETIDLIFDEQVSGPDLVLGAPLRWGIGYALVDPVTQPYLPEGRLCHWGGWGGSYVINDLDRRMTATYVMNRMSNGLLGSHRGEGYLRTLYGCLDA